MKKKVYSDPYMEIVLLNGEDIICASNNGDMILLHRSQMMEQDLGH